MSDRVRRTIPAAAVPKGAVVVVEGEPVTVVRVHNGDPVAGRIRWETTASDVFIGAATRVELLSLP